MARYLKKLLDRTNQPNPTETQTVTLEREESFGSILEDARHHEMQSFKEPEQNALDAATLALLGAQAEDGHWRYDLEADVTIPSEYIMLQRFFGRSDPDREWCVGNYPSDASKRMEVGLYIMAVQET